MLLILLIVFLVSVLASFFLLYLLIIESKDTFQMQKEIQKSKKKYKEEIFY